MLKIGITGNIASGKSEVEKIIAQKGYPVICADKTSHGALKKQNIKERICELFNRFDILENNEISRKKLGNIIFSRPEMKAELEKIIHPEVINEINVFFEKNEDKMLVFASVPLLFECGLENLFDKIIFVSADKKLRHKRILKRDGHDALHAYLRIQSQKDEKEKIQKSDFVIKNEGTLEDLRLKTLETLEKLQRKEQTK